MGIPKNSFEFSGIPLLDRVVYYKRTKTQEINAMTLTLNANGLHDAHTLLADLKLAIATEDYRVLQLAIKDLRAIGYYQGTVKMKKEDLEKLGGELLVSLEIDAQELTDWEEYRARTLAIADDKAEDERMAAIPAEDMSPIAREWLAHKDEGDIVMVYDPNSNGVWGLFTTFGSHARLMARALDREPAKEFGFTKMNVIPNHLWHDRARLFEHFGITIVLIGENAELRAA